MGTWKYWLLVIWKTTFSYFSNVALPVGLFYPTPNKLQFQIPLYIFWLGGLKPDFCSLALDSADYFHSNVFQYPEILVVAEKMHYLMLPNFTVCCAHTFGRAVVGPHFQKSMEREGSGGGEEDKGTLWHAQPQVGRKQDEMAI